MTFIDISMDLSGAAAGTDYYDLVLTNTSAANLTLHVTPVIYFVTDGGNPLTNIPVKYDAINPGHTTVDVVPEGKLYALLGIPNPGNIPDRTPYLVHNLLVTLPHMTPCVVPFEQGVTVTSYGVIRSSFAAVKV